MSSESRSSKIQETAAVLANRNYRGAYFRLTLAAPGIAALAQAGQFVHLLPPDSPDLLLRRPFSICDTDPAAGTITLVYKNIGAGTAVMAALAPGAAVSLLGPLGHGFPAAAPGQPVWLVAGGYGCAATYLVAKHARGPVTVMLGGRSAMDILMTEEFAALGATVQLATDDGSLGQRGFVTALLQTALACAAATPPAVYACGPNPMLRAVSRLCLPAGLDPAISLDTNMGCGVGACFTCVMKLRTDHQDGWEYVRMCKDGPVVRASQVLWE